MSVRSLGSVLLSPRHIDAIVWFERASNPVFQPTEYRSTNCCVPCYACPYCWNEWGDFITDLCGCLDIFGGGSGEDEEEDEEDERRCRPCIPPVGTMMYEFHERHYRQPGTPGRNHGVPGNIHYHHYEVTQRRPNVPGPCMCEYADRGASAQRIPGDIPFRTPGGGGLE